MTATFPSSFFMTVLLLMASMGRRSVPRRLRERLPSALPCSS
jgi:hypothetical protein